MLGLSFLFVCFHVAMPPDATIQTELSIFFKNFDSDSSRFALLCFLFFPGKYISARYNNQDSNL